MSHQERPRVAILASGGGSTAEAFITATQEGGVDADVSLVICNKTSQTAGVYGRVDKLNEKYGLSIPVQHISSLTHPKGAVERGQTDEESAAICEAVTAAGAGLVALMGYMKVVRGELVEEFGYLPHFSSPFQARMVNTHPGPLPETADTYGLHTSERVLELGMAASRHTVHVVSAGVDKGPIIAEHTVPIYPEDAPQDLLDRVQEIEKAHLPGAIDRFLKAQIDYMNREKQH